MAVDKLIDSTKENACRLAEANAIRAKVGTSAPITYDFANDLGFAMAIASIPAGEAYAFSTFENGVETEYAYLAYSESGSAAAFVTTRVKE